MNSKKKVNDVMVDKCLTYIKEHYNFEEYLRQHNLFEQVEHGQGTNVLIPCPYHYDYSPSMSVDLEGQRFKCFSCNRAGNYVTFVSEFDKVVNHINTNYYNTLDRLLKEDPSMQLIVGGYSIFIEEKVSLKNFEFSMRRPNFRNIDISPTSYVELANRMVKDHKDDIGNIKTMILLMQADFSPKEIYNKIYNQNQPSATASATSLEELKTDGVFNIQSLLGGDD